MTPPTIPPEAVEAVDALEAAIYRLDKRTAPGLELLAEIFAALLRARCALPHLRRAILETEVPRIVEMAREDNYPEKVTWSDWKHTPASILAALEKGIGE